MEVRPGIDEPLRCPTCNAPITSESCYGTVSGVCFHDLWLFHCRECHQPCMGTYVETHCQIWGISLADAHTAQQMCWRADTDEREDMTQKIGYDPLLT